MRKSWRTKRMERIKARCSAAGRRSQEVQAAKRMVVPLRRLVRVFLCFSLLIVLLPITLSTVLLREFAEWWHFGPSQWLLGWCRRLFPTWRVFKSAHDIKAAIKWAYRNPNTSPQRRDASARPSGGDC